MKRITGEEYTAAEFMARVGLDLLNKVTDVNKNKRLKNGTQSSNRIR